jgi:hypothetical protein
VQKFSSFGKKWWWQCSGGKIEQNRVRNEKSDDSNGQVRLLECAPLCYAVCLVENECEKTPSETWHLPHFFEAVICYKYLWVHDHDVVFTMFNILCKIRESGRGMESSKHTLKVVGVAFLELTAMVEMPTFLSSLAWSCTSTLSGLITKSIFEWESTSAMSKETQNERVFLALVGAQPIMSHRE